MSKSNKVLFVIFVMMVQLIQFLGVYSIALLNNRAIEFIFIFLSFQVNRAIFGTSYHSDSLTKCTLLSLFIFYLLPKGVLPVNISIFTCVLFGVYLAFILHYIKELIDNQKVPKMFYEKPLREQILQILNSKITEEEIENICILNNVNIEVAETVYLYLTNSKDKVSDILEIDPSTVIRRIKRFIRKTTER